MESSQADRLEDLIFLGGVYGWELLNYDFERRAIKFKRNGVKLVYFYDRGIVMTHMNHPKHGESYLVRKGVGLDLLETIMDYPRAHTNAMSRRIRRGFHHRFDI